jgi:hypothetical protein
MLSLLAIRSQQERQPVQGVVLFFEDSVKITAARIWHKACDVLCLRHVHLRLDSCCFFRTSCFSTCLMRTPPQVNFAPFFIRSKIASSPSRLMAVRFFRWMTKLRLSRSWLAFLQLLPSSATQGPTRVPSTIKVRRDGVSSMEILNMVALVPNLGIATRSPYPHCRGAVANC